VNIDWSWPRDRRAWWQGLLAAPSGFNSPVVYHQVHQVLHWQISRSKQVRHVIQQKHLSTHSLPHFFLPAGWHVSSTSTVADRTRTSFRWPFITNHLPRPANAWRHRRWRYRNQWSISFVMKPEAYFQLGVPWAPRSYATMNCSFISWSTEDDQSANVLILKAPHHASCPVHAPILNVTPASHWRQSANQCPSNSSHHVSCPVHALLLNVTPASSSQRPASLMPCTYLLQSCGLVVLHECQWQSSQSTMWCKVIYLYERFAWTPVVVTS